MDAANTIFNQAKRRAFVWESRNRNHAAQPSDVDGDEDGEDALRQAEAAERSSAGATVRSEAPDLPAEVSPVLEELPKWALLKEVLEEIEQEIHFNNTDLSKCASCPPLPARFGLGSS